MGLKSIDLQKTESLFGHQCTNISYMRFFSTRQKCFLLVIGKLVLPQRPKGSPIFLDFPLGMG